MNYEKYNMLIEKLTNIENKFLTHVQNSTESIDSVELLLPNTEIGGIPDKQLSLVHTMLHMFAINKSGKGLTPKTIEQLHRDVVKRLHNHKKYDKLDSTI